MKCSIIAVVAGLAVSGASGQLVVGNDQSGSASIYHVDVGTGIATPIYTNTTADAKPWGMAYDPASNTLYWNNGGSLYRSAFSMAITPSAPLAMTFNAATINFVALAFWNGQLVGVRNIATEAVYSIDTTTGVCTQLYVHSATFDFGGLDTDATNGKLYGLSDATGGPGGGRGLSEIDVVGQTQTFIAGYPAGETDIDGLAVHAGKAYYITDGPNTTQANFYVYDIATAAQTGTIPSPFTGSGTFCVGAYIAPPPPPACYPNCDGSTIPPILNVQDFGCFLNSFGNNETYANCDLSTTPPVLNVQDFGCFLNSFGSGCT